MKFPKLKSKRLLIGCVVLLAGLVIIVLRADNKKQPSPAPDIITHSTDAPDETKPGDDYSWRGAANDPKKIIIPSLSIDGYIQNVGVDQNKAVAVPNNIHLGGWFVNSVRPGEKGLSIIDGHLNGRSDDNAIFAKLANVAKDAVITVEFGDGSVKSFKVVDIVTVSNDEAANVLFSQSPYAVSQLNLITCGGNFDRNARLYDKRVIVSSELITN